MSQESNFTAYWKQLFDLGLRQPVTLEQQRKKDAAAFDTSQATSHTLKAEEIDAIRRLQSRGYRVIDLDPNLLPKDEFNCAYAGDIVANLTGENLTTTGIDGSGFAKCTNPYWRTFAFDCPGNFLKIEILPVRQEVGSGLGVTPLEQPISLVPTGTIATANPAVLSEASRRIMLLDFEAPTSTPHVVSDGMVFKTYFSAFYLTLKNLNTRVRITIGYNSEIQEREEKEVGLALFGGRGITTRSQIAPTAFSMNHLDVNPNNASGVPYAPPYNQKNFGLIINRDNPGSSLGSPIGNSIVWFTGYDARMIVPGNAGANAGLIRCDIMLAEINLLYEPVTWLKRIMTLSVGMEANGRLGAFVNQNLTESIRVSLPPLTGIFLRLSEVMSVDGSGTRFINFNLNGYVLGGFDALEQSGLAVAPFYTTTFTKENPWPLDYAFDGIPQR